MAESNLTPEELAETDDAFRARLEKMSDEELLARREAIRRDQLEFEKESIERDGNGRFVKGTRSPNPTGAPQRDPRRYGMTQTAKDMLELLEQPVTISKGNRKKQVPAIVAIYDRMIHMAVGGDWNAIKKCVELREKYSDFRDETLKTLFQSATDLERAYKARGEEMPPDVRYLVQEIERRVVEGQFQVA